MKSFKFPQRGEVWIVDFGKNIGSEQNGIRPAVVISFWKESESTCLVIPASKTKRYSTLKIRDYQFLLHQVRAVDIKRFMRKLERFSIVETEQVVSHKFLRLFKKTPIQ